MNPQSHRFIKTPFTGEVLRVARMGIGKSVRGGLSSACSAHFDPNDESKLPHVHYAIIVSTRKLK